MAYAQLPGPSAPVEAPPPAIKGKKVCLADVANSSLKPVATDDLKERFFNNLRKEDINVYSAYLVTMLADRIGMSPENKIAAKRQKCDYVLLSEIAKPNLTDQSPDHMKLDFALYKKGDWAKPLQSGSVPTAEAKDPTAVSLEAVDKVSAQIVPVLKQK